MPRRFSPQHVLAALLTFAFWRPALADTLLPSRASEILLENGRYVANQQSTGCVSSGAVGSACASFGIDPSVSVTTSTANGDAAALSLYTFEIVGGTGQERVPVIIAGFASSSATMEASGTGEIGFGTFNSPFRETIMQFGSGSASPGAFSIPVMLESNTQGDLDLYVTCGGNGSCASKIDPTITIDPSFADAAKFTIITDTGLTDATPEPSSCFLLGTALLGLAGIARLRPHRAV